MGQSLACVPTAETILVLSSQEGAMKSREWAALLEQTEPCAMMSLKELSLRQGREK